MRAKRKRKDSEEESDFQPEVYIAMSLCFWSCETKFILSQVDFLQLQMNTLRRYKRHYKLQLKPGTNKVQLVEVCLNKIYVPISSLVLGQTVLCWL